MPPATAPNRDAGILNQLLALKELSPPAAVIVNEGYIFAFAMPVLALAMLSCNSWAFTSGRLATRAEATPADKSSVNTILLIDLVRLMLAGNEPVNTLNAFSCREIFCCKKGINCTATSRCAVAC